MDKCKWYDCRGDVSYITNDDEIAGVVRNWANTDQFTSPMCIRDLWSGAADDLYNELSELLELRVAKSAFVVEIAAEEAEERSEEPLDAIIDDEDIGRDVEERTTQEAEMLEELPLPGTCVEEAKRKELCLQLPRAARAAIRRMHVQFGHCPKEPLVEVLRAAKCPQ